MVLLLWSTVSPAVASQSSDPISVDSGNEDNANVISSIIGETPEVSSEVGGVPDQQISAALKKLNESKKKSKGGASKTATPGKGASAVGVKENVDVVLKEKPKAVKGKGHVKANFPMFVPRWNVRVCDTTTSNETCHDMLRNIATPPEKELLSKLSDEDSAY
ncbi:hypothetical protein Hanom_Chr08g00718881 [Helianthus anomalus]